MFMFEIEVDYRALVSKLEKKKNETPNKLAETLNQSGMDAQGILMINSPIREGTLRGSHRVESRGLLERVIFPDQGIAPHALFVVLGTKPHIITGNPYLYWKGADHPVKKVNHPGTKANDYIKKSVPAIKLKVENNLQDFVNWLNQ